jgi:hypothetical protein
MNHGIKFGTSNLRPAEQTKSQGGRKKLGAREGEEWQSQWRPPERNRA